MRDLLSDSGLLNPPLPEKERIVTWSGLHGSATGMALAEAASRYDGVFVVVMEDQRQLEIVEAEIRYFQDNPSEIAILVFPGWECLPYDVFSPHQDIISERLKLLATLPELRRGIVLIQTTNLMQRLPPVDYVFGHTFSLEVGQKASMDELRERLSNANYTSVHQVVSPGEYTVRGGMLDVFPMGVEAPFRLDFFDDIVDSIRWFDPETQRTIDKVNRIELLPAREFPMTEQSIARFRSSFRKQFEGDPRSQHIYSQVSQGQIPAGADFFFPLFFEQTATLFEYLRADTVFVLSAQFDDACSTFLAEVNNRHISANHDAVRKVLPPEQLWLDHSQMRSQISQYPVIRLRDMAVQEGSGTHWQAPVGCHRQFPAEPRKKSPYHEFLSHLDHTSNKVLVMAETPGRREALDSMLRTNRIIPNPVGDFRAFLSTGHAELSITVGSLQRGFLSDAIGIEIICESQLYGERVYQRRQRDQKYRDPETIIKSLAQLSIGDPVVHIKHGVGRYTGLQILDITDEQTEFLVLEYQNNDKLYVPVISLNAISRFTGGSPEHAPLHRLGGNQWEKAKARAREKAYDVATELLEAEAIRRARKGSSYEIEPEDMERFSSQFPFEETPDQRQVIEEVIADLKSAEPMDRLVCGDVGFGKTEVALRAAFIVASCEKQVALIAPTTLLAQQHYQLFTDRFSDWPIHVAMLSRFNTRTQSVDTLARMENGTLDIVIGTHRLLQKDIRFSDLGLLIIDEEHRFGVRQKEQLKRLRNQVDILTLTATPIPRTLNMTLSGMRAISIISTPPPNRMSIKTFVRQWDLVLIREAVLREIRRGGQVFFLHNTVRTIEDMAEELRELIPEARIGIGHGQMPELQIERVMQDFYHQRFNLLVCSTIIESGIDIPSANTIIINRADRFGLAQLHQLRGRVGRSHHQAFAYLLIPDRNLITSDAVKRLDAIVSMVDLGAGFALASHDLEIRGAGELLGETQSGTIDEIGFSLYSEYLTHAVTAVRDGVLASADHVLEPDKQSQVELHLPALFPHDYLGDTHARLIFYKRIANSEGPEALQELQIEAIDRFGLLPVPAKNLFRITALRLRCEQLDIKKIDIHKNHGLVEFHDDPVVNADVIFSLIQRHPDQYQLAGPNALKITTNLSDPTERLDFVEQLLNVLSDDQHSRIQ